MKKKGGGKKKGGQFERTICKQLSLWMSHGKHEDWLWRSAGSGSSATIARGKGIARQTGHGDIVSVAKESAWLFKYVFIELKFYRNLKIEQDLVFSSSSSTISLFWNRAAYAAGRCGREHVLIAKQNNRPTVLCLPRELVEAYLSHRKCDFKGRIRPVAIFPKYTMCMYILDDFLQVVSPEQVRYAFSNF